MLRNFLLLLFFIFISCSGSPKEKNVLEPETYKNILKEIILANALSNNNEKNTSSKKYMNLVYKKYNIDSISLKKTTDYYTNHPEILEKIYEEIEIELKQKLDSLEINTTKKNKKKT